jgi:DNA-binding Lrp family transcriptional regulator
VTTRFDVERTVRASELPPSERLVLFVLLTHADTDPVIIPARFTPSLTQLASETGLDRTTVARILGRLESQGWIRRQRPPVEQSRKGARTRYRLTVPDLSASDHIGSGTTPLRVVAPRHQGSGTTPPEVVAQDHMGSGTTPPKRSIHPTEPNHSNPRTQADDEITAVIEALRTRTGKTIDKYHATLVIKQLVDGRPRIRDRIKYLTGSIAKDPDPTKFLPTPTPPRYQPPEKT